MRGQLAAQKRDARTDKHKCKFCRERARDEKKRRVQPTERHAVSALI